MRGSDEHAHEMRHDEADEGDDADERDADGGEHRHEHDGDDAQSLDEEGREIRIFPLKIARAEELARS